VTALEGSFCLFRVAGRMHPSLHHPVSVHAACSTSVERIMGTVSDSRSSDRRVRRSLCFTIAVLLFATGMSRAQDLPSIDRVSVAPRADERGFVIRVHSSGGTLAHGDLTVGEEALELEIRDAEAAPGVAHYRTNGPVARVEARREGRSTLLRFTLRAPAHFMADLYADRDSDDLLIALTRVRNVRHDVAPRPPAIGGAVSHGRPSSPVETSEAGDLTASSIISSTHSAESGARAGVHGADFRQKIAAYPPTAVSGVADRGPIRFFSSAPLAPRRALLSESHVASGPVSEGRPEGQEWTSVPVGGLTRDVEVELYGTTRTAAPGGLVVVRYSITSYEETEERMRLRLHFPEGWKLLDREIEEREFLLEAWEDVEGEIRVAVPPDARAGERHMIRVVGEVVGEPGGAAVFSYVHITRRGGLKPGQVGLTGTTSLQATSIAVESLEGARYGGTLELSGKLSRNSTLTLNYRQGPRETNLSNLRLAQEETRWSGSWRHPGWSVQFGNQLTSAGSAVTGPFVRGQGISLRRTEGLLIGDVILAVPTTFSGNAGGHLVRGSVGLRGRTARAAFVFSDFSRPAGGYSTIPVILDPHLDPEEIERLERERKAAEAAARNQVQGAGIEAEWRPLQSHRFSARAGILHLRNAAGLSVEDPSAEAAYHFQGRKAALSARWRQMPTSIQGVHLPGDEMAVDGSLKVIGDWRLAGRAHRTLSRMIGNDYRSENEGASLGVRYVNRGRRLDVRGAYRQWSWGGPVTEAHTVNASFGMPLGPLSLNGSANVGIQDNGTLRRMTRSGRGDLRWSGTAGMASWTVAYFETLTSPRRLRTDALGSFKVGGWEFAGGAWATHGQLRGGEPGFWTQIGIPLNRDLLVSMGIEHAPPDWGRPPAWLGTLGIRSKLTVPVPLLRYDTGGADRNVRDAFP
jgi:hypothetical protein